MNEIINYSEFISLTTKLIFQFLGRPSLGGEQRVPKVEKKTKNDVPSWLPSVRTSKSVKNGARK